MLPLPGKRSRAIYGAPLFADVLVPEFGLFEGEGLHHVDALSIIDDFDFNPFGAQPVFLAHEGLILPDDDLGNAIEKDGPAAHAAGGEGSVEGALAVNRGGVATGVFEGVHLSVKDGASFLDAAVVAAADDFSVVDDDAADWDSAFRDTGPGFLDCCF